MARSPAPTRRRSSPIHLAHPSGLHWEQRRVKNDERDALELVKRLRLGELPEAWIPPPPTRELRCSPTPTPTASGRLAT